MKTELEKTIMLAFLVFTKGSTSVYVNEDKITSKFAKRKRKLVRISLYRLKKEGLLVEHPRGKKYKLNEKGLKAASEVLKQGAKLWIMS